MFAAVPAGCNGCTGPDDSAGGGSMTPLRQRFIDDLRLRNYAARTIETYVSHLARFARHFSRSPDQLGAGHVRDYQLHLLSRRVSWSTFNQAVCALRFFFSNTCGEPEMVKQIPYGKRPRTLPVVLAPDETDRFLDAFRRWWLRR